MVWYEYLWQVPYWSQIIVPGAAFDDSWTRIYIRDAWEKFADNMCAYSPILQLKIINNTSIVTIELRKIPRDIWARVALSEITFPHRLRAGWCCATATNQSILPWILAYRIYIGEWSDRYGYIYITSAGAGDYQWNLIFFLFSHVPPSTLLKICVFCCQWNKRWRNQLSIFVHIFHSNTYLAFPKLIRL